MKGRAMIDEKVRDLQRTWNALDLAWDNPDIIHRGPSWSLSALKVTLAKLIFMHENLPLRPSSLSDTLGAYRRSL